MREQPQYTWILDRLGLVRSGDTWTGRAPAGGSHSGEAITVRLDSTAHPDDWYFLLSEPKSINSFPMNFYSFSSQFMDVREDDLRILYFPRYVWANLKFQIYLIPWEGGQEGWALALSVSCDPGLLGVFRDWLEDHPEYRDRK